MTYYIKLENKEDLEWLKKLISNTLTSPNSRVMIEAAPHVIAWDEALNNPVTQLPKAEPKPKPINTTRGGKKPKKEDPDPYTCPAHPKYKAERVPRSDCNKCWALYKQFHPLDYPQKRKAFERKHK